MVNMKVNKGNVSIGISGELIDIVAEIVYGIDKVHSKVKETSEEAGETFEAALMLGLFKIFRPDEADAFAKKLGKFVDDDDDDDVDSFIDDITTMLKEAGRK